jgi:hypothetical protein
MYDVCFIEAVFNTASFESAMAFVTSMLTVPAFGFGMRPFGTSTFPRRPHCHHIGLSLLRRRNQRNFRSESLKHILGANIIGTAASASLALSPFAKTARVLFAGTVRQDDSASACWSDYVSQRPA